MKRLCIVTFLLEHLSLSINIFSATFIKVKTAATMTSWQTGFQAKKKAPRSARFLFFLHSSSYFFNRASELHNQSFNLIPSLGEPLLVREQIF